MAKPVMKCYDKASDKYSKVGDEIMAKQLTKRYDKASDRII